MKGILKTRQKSCFRYLFYSAKEYGIPEPRFQEFDNMFRVELFRKLSPMLQENGDDGETSEKRRSNSV